MQEFQQKAKMSLEEEKGKLTSVIAVEWPMKIESILFRARQQLAIWHSHQLHRIVAIAIAIIVVVAAVAVAGTATAGTAVVATAVAATLAGITIVAGTVVKIKKGCHSV